MIKKYKATEEIKKLHSEYVIAQVDAIESITNGGELDVSVIRGKRENLWDEISKTYPETKPLTKCKYKKGAITCEI